MVLCGVRCVFVANADTNTNACNHHPLFTTMTEDGVNNEQRPLLADTNTHRPTRAGRATSDSTHTFGLTQHQAYSQSPSQADVDLTEGRKPEVSFK
jgi:hypothetical protein